MISYISSSNVKMPYINSFGKSPFYLTPMENDSFERTETPLSKTISYAKTKITEILKHKNLEYSFTIAPDGRILDESEGTSDSCETDSRKIEPNSILIHGHPMPFPLSAPDAAILLCTDTKTMEAVTVDGKYSRLTKKHPFKTDKSYLELYIELEKQLRTKALDELGIDYKVNKQDLIEIFKDYTGLSHTIFHQMRQRLKKLRNLV